MAVHGGEISVVDAHHARADRAAPAFRRLGRREDARVAKRLLGGGERELVRAVREFEKLAIGVDHLLIEPLDLCGDARGKAAGVEQRDRRHTASAPEQRIPRRCDVVAAGRDHSHARDRNAPFHRLAVMAQGFMQSPAVPSRPRAPRFARRATPSRRRSQWARARSRCRRSVPAE